jgi:hypothetical protein
VRGASRGKIPDYLGSMHIEFDILSAPRGCLVVYRGSNGPSLHSSDGCCVRSPLLYCLRVVNSSNEGSVLDGSSRIYIVVQARREASDDDLP